MLTRTTGTAPPAPSSPAPGSRQLGRTGQAAPAQPHRRAWQRRGCFQPYCPHPAAAAAAATRSAAHPSTSTPHLATPTTQPQRLEGTSQIQKSNPAPCPQTTSQCHIPTALQRFEAVPPRPLGSCAGADCSLESNLFLISNLNFFLLRTPTPNLSLAGLTVLTDSYTDWKPPAAPSPTRFFQPLKTK